MLGFFFSVIFGFVTSIFDIKYKKASNKHIIIGFMAGLLLVSFFVLNNPRFLELILLNIFVSFLIAFLLWYINFWPAGDAKLFMVYVLVIPFNVYKVGLIPIFPSITLLINSILPIFFILIIYQIFFYDKKILFNDLKKSLSFKNLFSTAIYLVSFHWALSYFISFLGFEIHHFVKLFILIIFSSQIKKFLGNKKDLFMVLLLILQVMIDGFFFLSLDFFLHLIKSLVVFFIGRFSINSMIEKGFESEKNIVDLVPGMVPVDTFKITDEGGVRYKRIRLNNDLDNKNNRISFELHPNTIREQHKILFVTRSGGLSEEDIQELIYYLNKKMLNSDKLTISGTIFFAPFLFMGVILTYLVNGNFIVYLIKIFFG